MKELLFGQATLKLFPLAYAFLMKYIYVSSCKHDGSENYVLRRITVKSHTALHGLDPSLCIAII